jgi:hypothetical protein
MNSFPLWRARFCVLLYLTIALVFQLSPAESQTKESCGFAADLAESLWLSGSKNSR